jgi:hypothetical protein
MDRLDSGARRAMVSHRNPTIGDFVGYHLIEYVQHASSHTDSPVTPATIREMVGPLTKLVWDQVDAFWTLVASEVTGSQPIDDTKYATFTNDALRSLIRTSYRRLPDGRWVGVANAAEFELRHKVRPPAIALPPA